MRTSSRLCDAERRRRARVALAAALVLLAGAPAHAQLRQCEGFAPVSTECTTGRHTRQTSISQDVAADVNYVGTIETSLAWSGGARIFRCTYTQVLRRSCLGSGSFPPVNASFTHSCRSIVPGTVVAPYQGVELNGVQGGIGTWACMVAF